MKFIKNKWVWLCGITWLLTPFIIHYARIERGSSALGGEIFIPFLPLVLWILCGSIKDVITGLKGVERCGKTEGEHISEF